MDFKISYRFHT